MKEKLCDNFDKPENGANTLSARRTELILARVVCDALEHAIQAPPVRVLRRKTVNTDLFAATTLVNGGVRTIGRPFETKELDLLVDMGMAIVYTPAEVVQMATDWQRYWYYRVELAEINKRFHSVDSRIEERLADVLAGMKARNKNYHTYQGLRTAKDGSVFSITPYGYQTFRRLSHWVSQTNGALDTQELMTLTFQAWVAEYDDFCNHTHQWITALNQAIDLVFDNWILTHSTAIAAAAAVRAELLSNGCGTEEVGEGQDLQAERNTLLRQPTGEDTVPSHFSQITATILAEFRPTTSATGFKSDPMSSFETVSGKFRGYFKDRYKMVEIQGLQSSTVSVGGLPHVALVKTYQTIVPQELRPIIACIATIPGGNIRLNAFKATEIYRQLGNRYDHTTRLALSVLLLGTALSPNAEKYLLGSVQF